MNSNHPTAYTALAAALDKCINTALEYDPATKQKLNSLSGSTIKVISTSPPISLTLNFTENEIEISNAYEETQTDVEVKGSLRDFYIAFTSNSKTFSNSNLSISGKISLLQQLKEIFEELDIDWEEHLIKVLGVIPGHALAESIRKSWQWSDTQKQYFESVLPHYLTEELKITPTASELNEYSDDIDALKSQTDRLLARTEKLLKNKRKP